MTGFDFCMCLSRWKEEGILEQAVGGLEKSEHKYDLHSELVYYAGYICGKKDSTGNGDTENGFV